MKIRSKVALGIVFATLGAGCGSNTPAPIQSYPPLSSSTGAPVTTTSTGTSCTTGQSSFFGTCAATGLTLDAQCEAAAQSAEYFGGVFTSWSMTTIQGAPVCELTATIPLNIGPTALSYITPITVQQGDTLELNGFVGMDSGGFFCATFNATAVPLQADVGGNVFQLSAGVPVQSQGTGVLEVAFPPPSGGGLACYSVQNPTITVSSCQDAQGNSYTCP